MSDNRPAGIVCTLVGDLVGSRIAPDQTELLTLLSDALIWTNERVSTIQPLAATVGDEFQGIFESHTEAFRASLLLTLRLTGRCDLRYGFGIGSISRDEDELGYVGQSGPAWWRAREAIEEVVDLQGSKGWPTSLRSRIKGEDPVWDGLVNGFLLCRDQILYQMDQKDARIAIGLFMGERQEDVAEDIGITQSTISSRQRKRGAATLFWAQLALSGEEITR